MTYASCAYGAAQPGTPDKRIFTFLDTIGSDACRQALRQVQGAAAERKPPVLPRLKWYAEGAGYQFTYLSLEEAFEYSVLGIPFSFWQVGGATCEEIPTPKRLHWMWCSNIL